MKKRIWNVLILALVLCFALSACGKKKQEAEAAKEVEEKAAKETVSKEEQTKYSPEVEAIVSAATDTSELPAFSVDTTANIQLNGKVIQGNFTVLNGIQIVQQKKTDLQMVMKSTSDIDDTVALAYYKDGWYYTDDVNGKKKLQKSAEEVLSSVTEISNLVKDEAQSIDQLESSKDGDLTIYTYHIPESTAENYINQVAKEALATNADLSGAKVKVESLSLTSVINKEGILAEQKLTISGTVKKSLFKVPVQMDVDAFFTKETAKNLDMPDFSEYQQ